MLRTHVPRSLLLLVAIPTAALAQPIGMSSDEYDAYYEETYGSNPVYTGSTYDTSCPLPSDAQCDEPEGAPGGYWQTACGGRLESVQHCQALYERRRADQTQGITPIVAPVPNDVADGYVRGDAVPFAVTLATRPTMIVSPPGWRELQKRTAWDANGAGVASCEEYAYEMYYDWGRFEDDVARAGNDYRAAFERGLALIDDSDHIADRSGIERARYRHAGGPKNVYFTLQRDMPPGTARYVWSDRALDVVDRPPPHYANHDPAWHAQMSRALSGYSDDMLDALRVKQAGFVQLMADRAAIMRRWTNYWMALQQARMSCDANTVPIARDRLGNPWFDLEISPISAVAPGGLDLGEAYLPGAFDAVATSIASSNGDTIAVIAPPTGMSLALAPQTGNLMFQMSSGTDPYADSASQWAGGGSDPYFDREGLPTVTSGTCDSLDALEANLERARAAVADALYYFDRDRLEPELLGAKSYTCLDTSLTADGNLVPSPCDWNPYLLVAESRSYLDDEREQARARCLRFTSDEFGMKAPIRNAERLGIATPERVANNLSIGAQAKDDWTGSTWDVERYLRLVEAYGDEVEYKLDPETGKAYAGETSTASDTLGNAMFGLSYSYGLGWRLGNFNGLAGAACNTAITAEARFDARAHVFGAEVDLLQALALVETRPKAKDSTDPAAPDRREFRRELTFKILGFDVLAAAQAELAAQPSADVSQRASAADCIDRDGDGYGQACPAGPDCDDANASLHQGCLSGSASTDIEIPGASFGFTLAKSLSEDTEKFEQTFPVAGVPVTIRAWATGTVGIDVAVKGSLYQVCPNLEAGLSGTVKPYAEFEVKVSGGVNLKIAEIGLQVDLTLLRVELPFKLDFKLGFYDKTGVRNGTETELRLIARPKLNIIFSTLKGQLRAYLKFPIGKPIYIKLFSWAGIVLSDVPLLDEEWSFPILQLAIGLTSGDQDYIAKKGAL